MEACLNSRPLGGLTSHSPDGISPLTPGHFLVGRPLQAYPETTITQDPSLFKKWNLCQALTQHFWKRWSAEYLQQMQKAGKWHKTRTNLQTGDLVLMTDGNIFATQWTMGKVVATYQGKDGLVRAVDVQTETIIQSPPSTSNKTFASKQLKTKTSIFRRPISKLALLLSTGTAPALTRGFDQSVS